MDNPEKLATLSIQDTGQGQTNNTTIRKQTQNNDGMIVEFITTYAISAYHHLRCEFGPRSGEVYSIQNYVIKFVSDLRQVGGFIRILRFLLPIKLNATIQLEYC
jgi:hypothetical protein